MGHINEYLINEIKTLIEKGELSLYPAKDLLLYIEHLQCQEILLLKTLGRLITKCKLNQINDISEEDAIYKDFIKQISETKGKMDSY